MRKALQRIVQLAQHPWDQQPGPQSHQEYERGYYAGKQAAFEVAAIIAREGLDA